MRLTRQPSRDRFGSCSPLGGCFDDEGSGEPDTSDTDAIADKDSATEDVRPERANEMESEGWDG